MANPLTFHTKIICTRLSNYAWLCLLLFNTYDFGRSFVIASNITQSNCLSIAYVHRSTSIGGYFVQTVVNVYRSLFHYIQILNQMQIKNTCYGMNAKSLAISVNVPQCVRTGVSGTRWHISGDTKGKLWHVQDVLCGAFELFGRNLMPVPGFEQGNPSQFDSSYLVCSLAVLSHMILSACRKCDLGK